MNVKISVDTELMKTQMQAQIMSPQKSFQTLQTSEGHTLLFSIGTDGVFYLTREVPGEVAGWVRTDLSSALGKSHLGETISAKRFKVAQNLKDGTVDIVLVIQRIDQDYVYTALSLKNQGATWAAAIPWREQQYDNKVFPVEKVVVADLYVAQLGKTSIVVDILEKPGDSKDFLQRYFLDPSKALTGMVWNKAIIPGKLNAGLASNCLGKKSDQVGIYTMGTVNSQEKLIYTPLYYQNNRNKPIDPPVNLMVPEGATAMAATVDRNGNTSLYVAGERNLYYFASSQQEAGKAGVAILESDLFSKVMSLQALTVDNTVTVWGRDDMGQIFYTQCALGNESEPKCWSIPIPIMVEVAQASSFLDQQYNSPVFIAHLHGGTPIELTQDPDTSLWDQRSIVLPSTDMDGVWEFNTYTSHVVVTDEFNVPQGDLEIAITSSSPVSVYINNQFTFLSPKRPVKVKTDFSGTITILQEINSLGAVCYLLQAKDYNQSVVVNPMVKLAAKLAEVKTGTDLANITITDDDGNEEHLVPKGTSPKDLDTAALALIQFVESFKSVPQDGSTVSKEKIAHAQRNFSAASFVPSASTIWGVSYEGETHAYFEGPAAMEAFGLIRDEDTDQFLVRTATGEMASIADAIKALPGNVFNWCRYGWNKVSSFFVKVIGGIVNFFITIGGKIYTFVLDCYQSITDAVALVFRSIKVHFAGLWKWLRFLFDWEDIRTTHAVIRNLMLQFNKFAISNLSGYRDNIKSALAEMEKLIHTWGDVTGLDTTPNQVISSAPAIPGLNGAASNYGLYQLKANASQLISTYVPPTPRKGVFDELITLLEKEEKPMVGASKTIQKEIIEHFSTRSIGETIKRFIAIVTNGLLQAAGHILLAAMDILIELAKDMLDSLTAKVEIPVLSRLYKKITGEDLTALDLACFVGAIPATILYKGIIKEAPFPQNSPLTQKLKSADSFEAIQALFRNKTMPNANFSDPGRNIDQLTINQIELNFTLSLFSMVGAVVMQAGNNFYEDPKEVAFKGLSLGGSIVFISPCIGSAACSGLKGPDAWDITLCIMTTIRSFCSEVFYPKIESRSYGIFDATISALWLFSDIIRFINSTDRYKTRLLVAGLCFNIGGILSFFISIVGSYTYKLTLIVVQTALYQAYGAINSYIYFDALFDALYVPRRRAALS